MLRGFPRGGTRRIAGVTALAALLVLGEGFAAVPAPGAGGGSGLTFGHRLAAQQPADTAADRGASDAPREDAAAPGDTVPATDSTRIRILRQLEALS
ncbi:MAG: hypothetical protein ACOC5J_03720, partial [Gemmatimonadota bacterium]